MTFSPWGSKSCNIAICGAHRVPSSHLYLIMHLLCTLEAKKHTLHFLFGKFKKPYIFIQDQNCKVKQPLTQMSSLKHREQQVTYCTKFSWLKVTGVFADQSYNDTRITINRQPSTYGGCQKQPNNCSTWDLRRPWATNPATFETGVSGFSFLQAENILALNQKLQSP